MSYVKSLYNKTNHMNSSLTSSEHYHESANGINSKNSISRKLTKLAVMDEHDERCALTRAREGLNITGFYGVYENEICEQ